MAVGQTLPTSINTCDDPAWRFDPTAGGWTVAISWTASTNDLYCNVYRSTVSGGPYAKVASLRAAAAFTDSTVNDGNTYYYVLTGLNILAQESACSVQLVAQPVSLIPPQLGFAMTANGLQFARPVANTGWRLLMNTNDLSVPGSWTTVSNSASTNLLVAPFSSLVSNACFLLA